VHVSHLRSCQRCSPLLLPLAGPPAAADGSCPAAAPDASALLLQVAFNQGFFEAFSACEWPPLFTDWDVSAIQFIQPLKAADAQLLHPNACPPPCIPCRAVLLAFSFIFQNTINNL
jgi:hypothetical protein